MLLIVCFVALDASVWHRLLICCSRNINAIDA
jgi:hypothetical protein